VPLYLLAKSDRIAFAAGDGTVPVNDDAWPHYSRVIVNGVFSRHVMCVACKTVLKWKSTDGTSGLKAHLQSCKANKACGSKKLTDCAGVLAVRDMNHVTLADKADVTKSLVRFCARDIRPLQKGDITQQDIDT